MSFTDITIKDYTDNSFIVEGDTRKYKEDLKKLGGKYNSFLKNGPGWIFPKTNENNVKSFIKKGKRLVTEEEAKQGEERTKHSKNPSSNEKESIVDDIKKMSLKIDLLENAILLLLNDKQRETLKSLTKISEKRIVKESEESVSDIDEDGFVIQRKRLLL